MNYSLAGAEGRLHLKIIATAFVCSAAVGFVIYASQAGNTTATAAVHYTQSAANSQTASVCRLRELNVEPTI